MTDAAQNTPDDRFPEITLAGNADERGYQHGTDLRDRIEATIGFYREIFGMTKEAVFDLARYFQGEISKYMASYATEIEAIASGSKQEPEWIYALNARTEILSPLASQECTSVCFPSTSLLGQTWDWGKELEKLAVVMRIPRETRPSILMLTEPGIIGKIGMNSHGIGVCLNILKTTQELRGVPIHIVLRSILDTDNLVEAQAIAERSMGTASNVLVASDQNEYFNMEYAGMSGYTRSSGSAAHVHTNHFCSGDVSSDPLATECSTTRLHTAQRLVQACSSHSMDELKSVLSSTDGSFPIFSSYKLERILKNVEVGTIATVTMDLLKRKVQVRKGNDFHTPFAEYDVQPS
jgi:isopenicillin-N N-acyltransferase like protein